MLAFVFEVNLGDWDVGCGDDRCSSPGINKIVCLHILEVLTAVIDYVF